MIGWLKKVLEVGGKKVEYDLNKDLKLAYSAIKSNNKWIKYEEFVNVYRIYLALTHFDSTKGQCLAVVVPKYFLSYVDINYDKAYFENSSEVLCDMHILSHGFIRAYQIVNPKYKILIKDKRYKFIGAFMGVQFYVV